jgi:hypothetical protein
MRVFNKTHWPYQYRKVFDHSVEELTKWCYENVKHKEWRHIGYYFVFKNSRDLTMFLLRWA